VTRSHTRASQQTFLRRITSLIVLSCIAACTAPERNPELQRRQVTECPDGMILICEGSNSPSRGGDEEIPGYERCYCRLIN
jgi:hypothetical protein